MAKEDPVEKIRTMIAEEVGKAFRGKERDDEEKSNPTWGKLRALIREEVGAILDEREASREPARPKVVKPEGEEDKGFLGLGL